MESLLNRYRNITVLLLVIMAQLVLLAVDAKVQGVPLIRVWAVTAVTPVARILESIRGGGSGVLHNYILLHDTSAENRRLKAELDRLKMENISLRNDLNTADRAKALAAGVPGRGEYGNTCRYVKGSRSTRATVWA